VRRAGLLGRIVRRSSWLCAGPVFSGGSCIALRGRDDLAHLEGELQHQPLPDDELTGDRAGVAAREQVRRVEQLVVADLDSAPQRASVSAGSSLDDAGVQGGEALQIVAGGAGLDDPDVSARTDIEQVGQALYEQRGQGGRRQHDAEGDAMDDREGGRGQTEGQGDGCSGP
jgi:hypothetical protein